MLVRHWPRWAFVIPLGFLPVVAWMVFAPWLSRVLPSIVVGLIAGPILPISCAASCFGFLALFIRFGNRRTRTLDSLSDNEYGMYLVHYAFVSWLAYAMLSAPLPAVAKFSLVFAGVVALSWATSAALRSIPGVARVV